MTRVAKRDLDPAVAFNRRAIRGRSSMNNAELKRKLAR